MPRFPKIDTPCPLARVDQEALGQDCSRCGKTVHALDALDARQRQALLRDATGSVCVSYRLPIHLGAALALSMAGSVQAAQQVLPAAETGQVPTTAPLQSPVSRPTVMPNPSSAGNSEVLDLIFVGGVSRPGEAEWIDDDSSVPELPIVHQSAESSR